MTNKTFLQPLLLLMFSSIVGCPQEDQQRPGFQAGSHFIRITDQHKLQTAAKTYTDKFNPKNKVVLVGMAHVGEADYYKNVQHMMNMSDQVLYEAILPSTFSLKLQQKGNPAICNAVPLKAHNLLSSYEHLAHKLHLSLQLSSLSYNDKSKNIDVSVGDLALEYMKSERASKIVRQHQLHNLDICEKVLMTLEKDSFPPDEDFDSRRELAEDMLETFQKEKIPLKEIILDFRNKTAVTEIVINAGLNLTQSKISTVIYGAAHMPGIEKELIKRGFVPEKEEWLTVFNY